MKLNLYDKAKQLSGKDFKQIIGVEKKTFDEMVMILNEAYLNKLKCPPMSRQKIKNYNDQG